MTMLKKCDDYFLFYNTIFIINIVIFIIISLNNIIAIIIAVIQPLKSVIFAIIFSQFSIHFFLFLHFSNLLAQFFHKSFYSIIKTVKNTYYNQIYTIKNTKYENNILFLLYYFFIVLYSLSPAPADRDVSEDRPSLRCIFP